MDEELRLFSLPVVPHCLHLPEDLPADVAHGRVELRPVRALVDEQVVLLRERALAELALVQAVAVRGRDGGRGGRLGGGGEGARAAAGGRAGLAVQGVHGKHGWTAFFF